MRPYKPLCGLFMAAALIFCSRSVSEAKIADYELMPCKATAYCVSGTTASGIQTREGICAAKAEWMGKTIIMYQRLPDGRVGEILGYYEVLDAGGTDAIKNGDVIDIYRSNLDRCQEFMDMVYEDGCKGNIYIQVVDAEG